MPDVLAAAACHRRLAARHGAATTHRAFTRAASWLDQQPRHPEALSPHWRRLALLRPGDTRIHIDEAAYQAATYPEIVQATHLLLTPHWQALAAAEHTRPAFFAAAGKLIGWPHDHRWHPEHTNPLRAWAHQQAPRPDTDQEARDSPRTGCRAPTRPWARG